MILAGSGLSDRPAAVDAGRAAAARALERLGGARPDWALVFATPYFEDGFEDLIEAVVEVLGTDRLAGCSGLGVLTEEGELEGRPGAAVLAVSSDQIRARPFLLGAPESADPLAGDPDDLMILTPDPGRLGEAVARGFLAEDGAARCVLGALSASLGPDSAQFLGARVATGGIGGMRLGGSFAHRVGVTQGCSPLGAPMEVSEGGGTRIARLDGRAALEALGARIPRLLTDDVARLVGRLFLAVSATGARLEAGTRDYLVRPILGMDAKGGALSVPFPVEPGMSVQPVIREPDAARDDLREMLGRLGDEGRGSDRFALYFNCCARGVSLYGVDGVDSGYLSGAMPGVPMVGFFGNGEIAPLAGRSHLFAYTGVLAVIAEA